MTTGSLAAEGLVQLAKARIAQAIRLLGDVLLPQDRQGDMLALQFAMDGGPVRLRLPRRPRAPPGSVESQRRSWRRPLVRDQDGQVSANLARICSGKLA